MPTVALLFGVHAHQPAGNFAEVVDDAHIRSYGPFLRTVYRYPEFRFAAHFSGWLLAELLERFPDDMALLAEMVARRQAELFGGGDMEPVLASIPARDRLSQLEALNTRIERAFGVRPHGAWLTERVWESSVVPSLGDAKLDYVTVDDYHFLCAGRDLDELRGYFTTEEDGRRLDLFPISEALRYRIPFAAAEDTVAHIESMAAGDTSTAAIYFDDIEKFGIWPDTYAWVYEQRWLERFIEGVLASSVIQPMHFRDFHRDARTRGIVYLPTTSYIEMGEWTLPAPRADDFAVLLESEKAQGRYERSKPFLRGGIWRNFLSRYSEANWMHKRMLGLSARVDALPAVQRTDAIQQLLHRAQANDAYWHGLFGGLYLPHLRRAVWQSLVALEARLETIAPSPALTVTDMDLDGRDEVFLRSGPTIAVIRDDAEAALVELSNLTLGHNFGDTLTKRREHYHRKLGGEAAAHAQGDGIASAHDRVAYRHAVTPDDAIPDSRPRASFVDTFIADDGAEPETPHYRYLQQPTAIFAGTLAGGTVDKTYRLDGARLHVHYRLDVLRAGRFVCRLNLAMPSCDGFLGRYRVGDHVPAGFGQPLNLVDASDLKLEDGVLAG
ncbi:MAG: DUF1925 domain-containing protein, partial [Burkholderiales bacterium]|nr:DUF1925 domain-containing protein [Burkholderiales bacterium]